MSTRIRRSFSFRSRAKQNQPVDKASQNTVKAADALLRKGDINTAIPIINTLIRKFPQNADCLWLFGRLCAAQKRYDPAISNFKQCLRLLSSHDQCYCSYGAVLYFLKKYNEAEEMYLQCLVLNAINHRCHYNYGQLQMTKGDHIGAEQHFVTAIKLYTQHIFHNEKSGYYQAYAKSLIHSDRTEEAYNQLQKAVELDPNNDTAHYLFAKVLQKMGKMKLAFFNIKTAIKLNPHNKEYRKYIHDLNSIKSQSAIQYAKRSMDLLALKSVDVRTSDCNTSEDIFDDVLKNNGENERATDNVLSDILSASSNYQPVIKDSLSVRNLVDFVEQTRGNDVDESSEEPPEEWWGTGSGHGTKFSVRQMYGDEDEAFHEMLDAATERNNIKKDICISNPTDDPESEIDNAQNTLSDLLCDHEENDDERRNPFRDRNIMKEKDVFNDEMNDMKHIEQKIDGVVHRDEVKQTETEQQQHEMDGPIKQFYNFLKNCRLEEYFDTLRENDCGDIRDIEYLMDDEAFLKETVGIKRIIHRKRLMGECRKLKERMDAFTKTIGSTVVASVLLDNLSKYGVVTMNILCKEVQNKNDLLDKFGIDNIKQHELLWNIIKKQSQVIVGDVIGITPKETTGGGITESVQREGVRDFGVMHGHIMDTAQ